MARTIDELIAASKGSNLSCGQQVNIAQKLQQDAAATRERLAKERAEKEKKIHADREAAKERVRAEAQKKREAAAKASGCAPEELEPVRKARKAKSAAKPEPASAAPTSKKASKKQGKRAGKKAAKKAAKKATKRAAKKIPPKKSGKKKASAKKQGKRASRKLPELVTDPPKGDYIKETFNLDAAATKAWSGATDAAQNKMAAKIIKSLEPTRYASGTWEKPMMLSIRSSSGQELARLSLEALAPPKQRKQRVAKAAAQPKAPRQPRAPRAPKAPKPPKPAKEPKAPRVSKKAVADGGGMSDQEKMDAMMASFKVGMKAALSEIDVDNDQEPANSESLPRKRGGKKKASARGKLDVTLHLDNLDRSDGLVMVFAKGKDGTEWAKLEGSLQGSHWEGMREDFPYNIISDSPTLIEDIKKEAPGVHLNIDEYTPPSSWDELREWMGESESLPRKSKKRGKKAAKKAGRRATLKPGARTPVSGQYRDTTTGNEITGVRGKRLPPTHGKGHGGFKLADKTKHEHLPRRSGRSPASRRAASKHVSSSSSDDKYSRVLTIIEPLPTKPKGLLKRLFGGKDLTGAERKELREYIENNRYKYPKGPTASGTRLEYVSSMWNTSEKQMREWLCDLFLEDFENKASEALPRRGQNHATKGSSIMPPGMEGLL